MIERRLVKRSAIQWLPFAGRFYRAVPAAVSDRRRAIRSRRLRPGDQHQPLRRQVGGRDRPGPASLLLPDADALRVGPVRCVFRPGSGRARAERAAAAGAGRAGPLGPRHRRAAYTAISLFLNMLRGGSRCTIIVSRPLCIPRSIPSSTHPPRRGGETVPPTARPNFLVVSALVPYKRVDLAMMAARRAGVGLTVVGDGPERAAARAAHRRRRRAGRLADRTKRFASSIARRSRPSCPAKKTSASCRSKRKPAAGPWWRSAVAARSTR